ncbi:hypothetical protein B4N89_01355 [Embleya scabrispora]|uniref:Uncharacterized protein n=1 Tax=Embleya scabrispora TaxID=159449 RepID=A0A1T3NSW6_9ACTN|nr:hypothetical protein [Embleya scabrispora]OPC79772.1 hypothetical protein B4N89_01355 [Embleya scabrispora]
MSGYYVQYSDRARSEYAALSAATRRHFDHAVVGVARDPYAHGAAIRGNKDRRSACLAGVITEYEISRDVLVVTMLKVVGI